MNYLKVDDMFLNNYPDGVHGGQFIADMQKHTNSAKVIAEAASLDVKSFDDPNKVEQNTHAVLHLMEISPMVSRYEKAAFKDMMDDKEYRMPFLLGLQQLLLNTNEETFDMMNLVLQRYHRQTNKRINTWPINSFFLAYVFPNREIIVRPNTIKKFLKTIESDVTYSSSPNWQEYLAIKKEVYNYKDNSKLTAGLDNVTIQAIIYSGVK